MCDLFPSELYKNDYLLNAKQVGEKCHKSPRPINKNSEWEYEEGFRFLVHDLDGYCFPAVSVGLILKEKAIKILTLNMNIINNTRFAHVI